MRGTRVGIAILAFCLAYIISLTTAVDLESSLTYMKKLSPVDYIFLGCQCGSRRKTKKYTGFIIYICRSCRSFEWYLFGFCNPPSPQCDNGRQAGTMSVASTFAGLLMLTGLVALGKFFFNEPKNFWVLGGFGIISLCLMIVLARQAWLGFLVGSIFLVFFWRKKFLWVIPLVLVICFFVESSSL